MKKTSVRRQIFRDYLLVIILLTGLTTLIFNLTVRAYIEQELKQQIQSIAERIVEASLRDGPDIFPGEPGHRNPPPAPPDASDRMRFFWNLDRSLRDPLSLLNADCLLLDNQLQVMNIAPNGDVYAPADFLGTVTAEIQKSGDAVITRRLSAAGEPVLVVMQPVAAKNNFGLSWVIIYSSTRKIEQLQWRINAILAAILLFSALGSLLMASHASRRITAPLRRLSAHMQHLARRDFSTQLEMPAESELQEIVASVNHMALRLGSYDEAQKTFLQNASHEFRTPLMSIRSYAEGISHGIIPPEEAARVIQSEATRMSALVEDLLYLSRLEDLKAPLNPEDIPISELLTQVSESMASLASAAGICLQIPLPCGDVHLFGDGARLHRALVNVLANALRHARSEISLTHHVSGQVITLTLCDDGPGFSEKDLPHVFERFYKGRDGHYGLGLAITHEIIRLHHGSLEAFNTPQGACVRICLPLSPIPRTE